MTGAGALLEQPPAWSTPLKKESTVRHATRSLMDRLFAKVEAHQSGCWMWTGYTTPTGHGQIQRGRRGEGAMRCHVAAYELLVGPVPDGMIVHHQCETPACVNPAHLQPMTRRDHLFHHMGFIEGECIHGHARTPENVYRNPRGIVSCRPCHTKWSREWKQSHAS